MGGWGGGGSSTANWPKRARSLYVLRHRNGVVLGERWVRRVKSCRREWDHVIFKS